MPPRVEIQYLTLTGENERMLEKENEIRLRLLEKALGRLKAQGFTVIDFDFQAAIEEDEEFAYVVTQVREGFDQASKDLKMGARISEDESKSIQTSVGEAVNIISEKSGADAILLIRFSGFEKSAGHVAKDVSNSILVGLLTLGTVIPVQSTSGAVTEFALIDGVSGDVLWADFRGGDLSDAIGDQTMESMPLDNDPKELNMPKLESKSNSVEER